MSNSLYITAAEARSGKSAVTLGVMEILLRKIDKVDFFRPIIQGLDDLDNDINLISYHCQVQHYDITELACKISLNAIYKHVTRRDKIIASVGSEFYFMMLDMLAEYLAYLSEGKTTHCCFIAQKK